MKKIDFSSIHMPYKAPLNKNDQAAWVKTVEWVQRFELLSAGHMAIFPTLDYHLLSSYAFPEASVEQLSIVNDYMTAFYLFDKVWDDAPPEKLKKMQPVMRMALCMSRRALREPANWLGVAGVFALSMKERLSPGASTKQEHRFLLALMDLHGRMYKHSTRQWREHFHRSMRDYFDACLWESENKLKNHVPDVEEYIVEREKTGGVKPSFELAGVLGLVKMPAEMLDSPSIKKLSSLANQVITLFNDLISLEKEMRVGDMHNLVFIIQNKQKCSLEEAIERVVKRHNDTVAEFEKIWSELQARMQRAELGQGELEEWAKHEAYKKDKVALFIEVRRYVGVLQAWMFANMEWSLMSERYKSPEAPAA
ncbi:terpene synthase family protein [Cystobacter fuscus]